MKSIKALRFTAAQWAIGLTALLDLLALSALFLTGEVPATVFGLPLLLWIGSRLSKRPLHGGVLVGLFAAVFASTLYFWFGLHFHPITAVAWSVPVAHALIWLAPRTAIYRGWRIGLGFIELILSSGLTADVYLPVFISIFVVLTSVALSCDFMDRELALKAPEERDALLNASFIRNSIGMAILIFLTSAAIFPLLPRPKGAIQGLELTAGYSESVSVANWSRNRGSGEGETKLRLFFADGADPMAEIYMGLIRGRTLDAFDGKEWFSQRSIGSNSTPTELSTAPSKSRGGAPSIRMEAIRESLDSDSLPVPYGTQIVQIMAGDHYRTAPLTPSGDWSAPGTSSSRVSYSIELASNDLRYLNQRANVDAPKPMHTFVPSSLESDAMDRLSQKIFAGARDPQEKLKRVTTFFRSEGFTAVEGSTPESETVDRQLQKSRLTPLEQFLFVTRQGHCEWFATATAVLLRMGGVPTRLVAGFRLTRGAIGGVLSVRSGDGHAWVEAFIPGRGWIPIDPTPRVSIQSGVLDKIRQISDLVGAYWFKYVVSFSEDLGPSQLLSSFKTWTRDLLKPGAHNKLGQKADSQDFEVNGTLLGVLFGFLTGSAVILWMTIRQRAGVDGADPRLRAERRKMARALKLKDFDPSTHEGGTELVARWQRRYLLARFGVADHRVRQAEIETALRELRSIRTQLVSSFPAESGRH